MIRGYRIWLDRISTSYGTQPIVDLVCNPLSADSVNIYIPQLQNRGVMVYYNDNANQPPEQPANAMPVDAEVDVDITPLLFAVSFSDPNPSDRHAASQWQIATTSGDYSSPVLDQVVRFGSLEEAYLFMFRVPPGILNYAMTYYWRARYQDNCYAWSEWSAETSFTTTEGPGNSAQIPGDANGDGVISALDITVEERIIAGLDPVTPGADANQDGSINCIDVTKVERIIAGLD